MGRLFISRPGVRRIIALRSLTAGKEEHGGIRMNKVRNEERSFIAECVIDGAISMIWYRNILFRCLPSASYGESRAILWIAVVVFGVIGMTRALRNQRSTAEFAGWMIVAYGLYTALAYAGIEGRKMAVCAGICLAFSCVYGIWLWSCAAKRRRRRQYIARYLRVCSLVLVTGAAAVMLLLGLGRAFGNSLIGASVPVRKDAQEMWTVEEHMDTISMMREEVWSGLSAEERLNVLQVVANIESSLLGLPNEVQVGAANLSGSTRGEYSDDTHRILIDLTHLMENPVRDVLNTCCHEVYHSYQHRLVDAYRSAPEEARGLYLYSRAAAYDWEFGHYQHSEEHLELYMGQLCESDSRAYASCAVDAYFRYIEEYGRGDESGADPDAES